MKNAMKKLLSLVLVAMLLVSVLPLGAMATNGVDVEVLFVTKAADGSETLVASYKYNTSEYDGGEPNWSADGATEWAARLAGLDSKYEIVDVLYGSEANATVRKYEVRDTTAPAAPAVPETPASDERIVTVTFQTPAGDKVWTYSDKIGKPNWTADAAAWAMNEAYKAGKLSKTYDNVKLISTGDGYNAVIKVWDNERQVTVTFQTPNGNVTWSYAPSSYDNGNNNGGAPVWTDDAAKWAMNEAYKAGKLSKTYDNAELISTGDGYNATIKVYDNKGNSGSSENTGSIALIIKVNDVTKVQKYASVNGSSTVSDLIKANLDANWTANYTFNNVIINGTTYGRADVSAKAGEAVTISLSRKFSKDNSNKVYLHVFLNGDASTIVLTKDITGTYLMDDWSTNKTEILNYLKANYYTAKDSTKAMELDGLYLSENGTGTFPTKYYADDNVSKIDDIDLLLEDNFVHISVMLKNAKAKTTSTADSTNPKTGDSIYMTVTVMGLSVAALAAVYYVSKKRVVR